MKQILLYFLVSFALCMCQQPPADPRCSIYDNECTKNFFQNIAVQYAATGIPEAGIPIIDPFRLSNVTLSILGLVDLTLIEGEADGIGKCVVTKFETNIPARWRQPEVICSKIVIKGHYKISSAPILGHTCSWCNIHGDGHGTIVLEDWFFKFRYPFKFVRRADGQIYMDAEFDKAVYKASVNKVTVAANSIMSGKHDITKSVVNFVNKHWKLLMDSNIGKFINDQSAQYYYGVYDIFFTNSPANSYLRDDLTPLLDSPETTTTESPKKEKRSNKLFDDFGQIELTTFRHEF